MILGVCLSFRVADFLAVAIFFVNFFLCGLVVFVCCHVFAIFALAGSECSA